MTTGPSGARREKVVPFWALQTAEILVMVALVDLSLHVERGAVLIGAGAAFALAAVTADGPLGAVRVCSRRLHVRVVTAVAVAVAVAPVVPTLRPDWSGIVLLAFTAVGVVRLATLTSTEAGARRERPGTVGTAAMAGRPVPDPMHAGGSGVGATGGSTVAGPRPVTGKLGSLARLAGRSAAHASDAASRHRPTVVDGTKRAVRTAGRTTARARSRSFQPESGATPGTDRPVT